MSAQATQARALDVCGSAGAAMAAATLVRWPASSATRQLALPASSVVPGQPSPPEPVRGERRRSRTTLSQQSFADLGVSDAVARALAERGITQPFAVQRLVVADILAGRDVLLASPTGSGKTLAFGVPLVERIQATDQRPAALILAPTRELATQIVEETRHVAHARALKI